MNNMDAEVAFEVAAITGVDKEPMVRYERHPGSITLENAQEYLRPVSDSADLNFIKTVIRAISEIKDVDIKSKKQFIIQEFRCILAFKHLLHHKDMASLCVVLKAKFHEFIHANAIAELIPIYDEIFNDELYGRYERPPMEGEIPQDYIDECLRSYKESIASLRIHNVYNKKLPKFAEKEVVGAKDREGHWYMAQVKKVFSYENKHFYFISFFGWGDEFDEIITDPYRIQHFNPRKHVLYRSVWNKKT